MLRNEAIHEVTKILGKHHILLAWVKNAQYIVVVQANLESLFIFLVKIRAKRFFCQYQQSNAKNSLLFRQVSKLIQNLGKQGKKRGEPMRPTPFIRCELLLGATDYFAAAKSSATASQFTTFQKAEM